MLKFKNYLLLCGLIILVSCGTPNDPESIFGGNGGYNIVGRYETQGEAHDIFVDDSLAYIAQGQGGLLILDIVDRTNPKYVSFIHEDARGYLDRITKKGDVVYLAAGSFGVTAVEVDDPANPEISISNLNIKPATNFLLLGEWLITAVDEHGFNISDISYPQQPDIRTYTFTPGYAQGLATNSDSTMLLVADGEMGLAVMDISNINEQQGFGDYPLLNSIDVPGYATDVILVDDRYACLACGTGGLSIVDIADSANYVVTATYNTGGYAKEIAGKNDRLYITTQGRGLQMVSISDPYSPQPLGVVKSGYANGVALDDNYIYVADREEGIIIIEIPN